MSDEPAPPDGSREAQDASETSTTAPSPSTEPTEPITSEPRPTEPTKPSPPTSPPRWRRWLPSIGVVVLSLAASLTLWRYALTSGDKTGFGDWQYFVALFEAGRVAVTRYGELPLYNPFDCGGVTMWGNPQLQSFSPYFLLVLTIGTTWATKLSLILHTAIGVAGGYLFARREVALGRCGSILAGVAWACGGFFAWHGAGGHSAFLPFAYAPWLLLAWRASARDLRWCAAVAGIFALTLSEGGVYPPAFFALLLAFDAIVRLSDPATRKGIVLAGIVSAVCAATLSAFRLVPVRELLSDIGGRAVPDNDVIRPKLFFRMFLDPDNGPWRSEGSEYVWPEYASYVGPIVFGLGVIGCAITLWKKGHRWIGVGAILFGATMLGHVHAWAPFAILRAVPVFDSFRVPSRYVVFASFYLALGAGLAVDLLARRLGRVELRRGLGWTRHALPVVLVAGALVFPLWVNGKNAKMWNGPPLPTAEPTDGFMLEHPARYANEYASYPQRNRGTPGCYEAFDFTPSNQLRWGPQPQWIVQTGDADVRETRFTTSTWSFDVNARQPSRITLNRNYDRHWVTDAPAEMKDSHGLLAFEVPRGRHAVTIRYRPASLGKGFAISALGILLCALVIAASPSRLARIGSFARRIAGPPRDA